MRGKEIKIGAEEMIQGVKGRKCGEKRKGNFGEWNKHRSQGRKGNKGEDKKQADVVKKMKGEKKRLSLWH